MNQPDLEEFGTLWKEPGPAEAENFIRMARRARLQGRLLAYSDVAWAVLIVGGSLFATLSAPGPRTMVFSLFLLIATVWLTWKRRKIRQMRRTLDTTDRQAFFASSVANARSDLRRVTLSMLVFPLLVPGALLVKVSFRTGADINDPVEILTTWAQTTRGVIVLTLLALVLAHMWRSRRRIKGELRRLEELKQAYDEAGAEESPQLFP